MVSYSTRLDKCRPFIFQIIEVSSFACRRGAAVIQYDTEGVDPVLPKDPYILLSYINTKLRDEYPSLDLLCEDLPTERSELEKTLADAGFAYDPEKNQFR